MGESFDPTMRNAFKQKTTEGAAGKMMHSFSNPWLCHQLGSREHYSIPRALHAKRRLALLQTDAWVPPAMAKFMPGIGPLQSLAGRYHESLATAQVRAFTLGRLKFDVLSKLRREPLWQAILQRNRWFQARCLPGLRRGLADSFEPQASQPTVFAFSYAARELFHEAKRLGARCVLGQVDPGPEEIRWVAEKCGGPDPHGSPPPAYWEAWREEVELADVILANSEWSRSLLVKGGVPTDKIQVVPLAYEVPYSAGNSGTRHFPDAFSSSRPLRVLYLGQVIPRKGAHELFDAILLLQGYPVEFHLAGPVNTEVPEAIKAHSGVHFYGPVSRTQGEALYARSDVFLLPSHSEGFGLTQLEAVAHRLPLIASRYCASVVGHEKNGLLLDDVTPAAIVQALQTCLQSPESLQLWGQYELDWKEYSLETLANRLNGL
jgi:glycosyltransferase involved in cell wall biosynthesis